MTEHLPADERTAIVDSAVAGARSPRERRRIGLLAGLAVVLAVVAGGALTFAYVQSNAAAERATQLAEQLDALCRNTTRELSDEGKVVCADAARVVEEAPASVSSGPRGAAGSDGIDGLDGPQGVAGAQGPQGVQGVRGLQGVQGPRGLRGRTGPAGTDGTDGTDGVDGTDGSNGTDGTTTTGPPGPAGPQGPAGPAGQPGADGQPGTSAYPFTFVFTVDDIVASTTYTVTCTAPDTPCEVTTQ